MPAPSCVAVGPQLPPLPASRVLTFPRLGTLTRSSHVRLQCGVIYSRAEFVRVSPVGRLRDQRSLEPNLDRRRLSLAFPLRSGGPLVDRCLPLSCSVTFCPSVRCDCCPFAPRGSSGRRETQPLSSVSQTRQNRSPASTATPPFRGVTSCNGMSSCSTQTPRCRRRQTRRPSPTSRRPCPSRRARPAPQATLRRRATSRVARQGHCLATGSRRRPSPWREVRPCPTT